MLQFKYQIHIFLFFLVSASILIGADVAVAESAISCHCFKDRAYNPDNKLAADKYILATTFNSLVSYSFKIPKKQIVFLKMKEGVSNEDLLIGQYLSRVTGLTFEDFFKLRSKNQSWSQIAKKVSPQNDTQNDSILQAIRYGVSDIAVSSDISDQLMNSYFKVPLPTIKKLRLEGFNSKEIVLLLLLSKVSHEPAESIAAMFVDEGKSWSEIANNFDVEPSAAGKIILNTIE